MQVLLPIMGGGGSLIMIIAHNNPIMLVAGGAMLLVTVLGAIGMFVSQRTGAARRFTQQRHRYLDYLDEIGDELRAAGEAQRALAHRRHPDPATLPDLIRDPRLLWERRLSDPDFLVLRVGLGTDRLWRQVTLRANSNPLVELDPVTHAAARLLVDRDRTLDGMPIAVPIDGVVSVVGPAAATHNVLRAMLAQLAALHAPDDVRVAWCLGRGALSEFEWAKWLPHSLDPEEYDGPAPRRLIAHDGPALAELLRTELDRRLADRARTRRLGVENYQHRGRRLVVIIDHSSVSAVELVDPRDNTQLSELGIATVVLVPERHLEPSHVDVRVICDSDQVTVEDLRETSTVFSEEIVAQRRQIQGATSGTADTVTVTDIAALTRQIAPLRLVADAVKEAPLETTVDLRGLLGIEDENSYEIESLWKPRPLDDFLKVPFGVDPTGNPVYLDFKESALGGMGPHGLCVGATGSGKSEVLRTLVLTLAMTHPPERLSLVLVDYKGGATFAGLEDLPHTSAMISNLSEEVGLVDRLHDAIQGEMTRRQEILLEAGQLPNITEYNRRRDAGIPLPPLPNLLIVIDEFSELLDAKPEFLELLIAIGRIGRSIGLHQLLASQRLEEGKLRGLESFLSYRLGLRTFNAQESQTVLGVPDAYHLPPFPGSGYLKVDTTIFQRFKAAYVSGPYRPASGTEVAEAPPTAAPFLAYNEVQAWLDRTYPTAEPDRPDDTDNDVLVPTTLDVVVRRLAEAGTPAHRIWLPPLPKTLPLDSITGPLEKHPGYGLTVSDASRRGTLRIPLGLLDRPTEQKQEPFTLDLAGSAGHLCVLGAPQTGKSTLLRTLILSAAVTHTPHDIGFYCVDLGGGSLSPLVDLPHVAGVAGRLDPDRVRRTVAEVAMQLSERERLFATRGIDSIDTLRQAHREGRLPEIDCADIVLVIDNYPALRSDFEDLTDMIQDIGSRGLGYGIHLVLTAGRWADLRMQLQAVIGTRIELALNDALDSSIKRKVAETLQKSKIPGRCLTQEELIAHIALPRLDGGTDPGTTQAALEAAIVDITNAWDGPRVPPIRMLPTLVPYEEVVKQAPDDRRIRLGLDETELRPVFLDLFGADPHLLIFGDSGSGKTSVLNLIVTDLISRFSDSEVVFAVIDVRRTLLDVVPDDYLGAYAGTLKVAQGLAHGVASELQRRLPPDDVTRQQLRERSWWKGPEIVVLCDDYDLVSPGGPGPLAPFLEYLPQARDVGFHLVIARRSGGAGRAMHEPVPQRMREVGCTGLLLSGERQEGQLWPGAYMSPQPPGRGFLVRKARKPQLIQTAFVSPTAS